jgi:hypothetical protein
VNNQTRYSDVRVVEETCIGVVMTGDLMRGTVTVKPNSSRYRPLQRRQLKEYECFFTLELMLRNVRMTEHQCVDGRYSSYQGQKTSKT